MIVTKYESASFCYTISHQRHNDSDKECNIINNNQTDKFIYK